MYIWFLLLIPCLVSLYMGFYHKQKFVWWELGLPFVVCFICITIAKLTIETYKVSDIEYNGEYVTKVTYYEPYTTYVRRTCYRTVRCGKSTVSVPYDCSYCDEVSDRYEAETESGRTYSISREQYLNIRNKWNNSTKIELNRDINYHFGCGQDGDAYVSVYNNIPKHSENAITNVSFVNKVKVAKQAFHFIEIDDDSAKKLKLYSYPDYYNVYKQHTLIGFKDVNDTIQTKFQYLNTKLNKTKKSRILILAFYNKPNDNIAELQRHYWLNGKDNEVVICLGLDKQTNKIQWVYTFSWTDSKRVLVELREEINEMNYLDYNKLYNIVDNTITHYYKKKNFNDYNYLTVEVDKTEFYTILFITLLVTFGVNYYCYVNEFED